MQENPTRYDVFISYRRKTAANLAFLLKRALEEQNIQCFYDIEDLENGYFPDKLKESIGKSNVFLFLHTESSLENCTHEGDFVREEILTALKKIPEGNIVILSKNTDELYSTPEQIPLLPDKIKRFTKFNAVRWDDKNQGASLKDLIEKLKLSINGRIIKALHDIKIMDQTICTKEYMDWVVNRLELFYEKTDRECFTHFFPVIGGKKYPIAINVSEDPESEFSKKSLRASDFEDVKRTVGELPDLKKDAKGHIPDWVTNCEGGAVRADYFKLLSYGNLVRRWNMRGFALKQLLFNEKRQVIGYDSTLCTYGENCLTSHVLGYDLYLQFQSEHALRDYEYYHGMERPRVCLEDGVKTPDGLFPLISVQAIVAYKDPEMDEGDQWKLICMQRGSGVAAAAGFYQFPPAGGFEIYGTENDTEDHFEEQYDMRLALIREFLEEIYGDFDMSCEIQKIAESRHQSLEGYSKIMDALRSKIFHIHFLGVVTELVGMRSEFSFLIVLDNFNYFENLRFNVISKSDRRTGHFGAGSHEGKKFSYVSIKDCGKKLLKAEKIWNPSSIGMLQLLADSSVEKDGWLRRQYPDFPEINLSVIP